MNKQAFLEELRGYLSVLEDQEQEDIMEEYSQHIDMKLQKGLSEEEAIRDFGSMKELAAEILEAYHVKPEFGQQEAGFHLQAFVKEKADRSGQVFRRMGSSLKEKSAAVVRGIHTGFLWMGRKGREFAGWLVKPYQRYKGRKDETAAPEDRGDCPYADGMVLPERAAGQRPDGIQQEKSGKEDTKGRKGTADMAGSVGKFFWKAGKGIAAVWSWFLTVCFWGLRLMWNGAWLFFALFCACMAMFVLAGLGAMLILLVQGYPLMGMSLMALGGILCFGSLAAWAYSMMIRKKNGTAIRGKETVQSGEEVQYE